MAFLAVGTLERYATNPFFTWLINNKLKKESFQVGFILGQKSIIKFVISNQSYSATNTLNFKKFPIRTESKKAIITKLIQNYVKPFALHPYFLFKPLSLDY